MDTTLGPGELELEEKGVVALLLASTRRETRDGARITRSIRMPGEKTLGLTSSQGALPTRQTGDMKEGGAKMRDGDRNVLDNVRTCMLMEALIKRILTTMETMRTTMSLEVMRTTGRPRGVESSEVPGRPKGLPRQPLGRTAWEWRSVLLKNKAGRGRTTYEELVQNN